MPPTKKVYATGAVSKKAPLIIDFINVGQGNCVLVTYPSGELMLVDAGSQQTSLRGTAFKNAAAYISAVAGGRNIGCVVLSHGDNDHTAFVPYIPEAQKPVFVHYGGTPSNYSADLQAWIDKMEAREKTAVYRFKASGYSNPSPDADFGSDTDVGDAHVAVLAANYGSSPNEKSIVLMIKYGNQMIVLPGDAEAYTEQWIMTQVPATELAACTLLMPGHHGAYEATTDAWVQALQPEVAVISASGSNASYAHPNCATIKLLSDYMSTGVAEKHTIVCSAGKGKPYKTSETTRAQLVTATQNNVRWITDGVNVQVFVSTLLSQRTFEAVPQFETPLERLGRLERVDSAELRSYSWFCRR